MSLDSWLLSIVCDPVDRGPLWYVEAQDVLVNPRTAQVYAVVDDIAVLLPDEARVVDAGECARLLALPGVMTGPR
jgi:hypothetical protein